MAINKFVSTRNKNRNRLIPLMGGLDDGSMLSLDFTTMGSLDSRFTFSRSGPATFINSQGRVRYATHNFLPNTVWTSTSLPTGWSVGVGTGQITYNGDGSITMGVTSTTQRIFLTPSTAITVTNGLKYRIAFQVQTAPYLIPVGELVSSNGGTDEYYINGSAAVFEDTVQGGDYVEVISTATGSTMQPRIGVGVSGVPSYDPQTIRVLNPMMNIGGEVLGGNFNYVPNTTTSPYQTARFDYDPTTLAPRGLLIEASATNLLNWSESFETSGGAVNWNYSALNATRGTSTQTNPMGVSSTVVKIEETSANGSHGVLAIPSASASTTYTGSVFAKAAERSYVQLFENNGSFASAMVNLSNGAVVSESTAGITTVTALGTTGWYRISMRFTTGAAQTSVNFQLRLSTNGTTTSYAGTTGSGIYAWGAQVETGSGASSYIPTGASTVQRAADSCSIALSSFGFSTTGGTFFADWYRKNNDSGTQGGGPWNTDYASSRWFGVQNAVSSNTVSLVSWSGQTNIANGSTRNKAAATYGAWTGSVVPATFCVNNSAVSSANRDFNPSLATYLTIGAASSSAGSSPAYGVATRDWLNNSIRSIKYWPTILPDAILQNLTQ